MNPEIERRRAEMERKRAYYAALRDLHKINSQLQYVLSMIGIYEKRISYSIYINGGEEIAKLRTLKEDLTDKQNRIKNIIIPYVESIIYGG